MDPVTVQIGTALLNFGGLGVLSLILYLQLRETRNELRAERAANREELKQERNATKDSLAAERAALVSEMQAERQQCARQWQDLLQITHEKIQESKDAILNEIRRCDQRS